MFRSRSILRLFHPTGIPMLRKTPTDCNYHKTTLDLHPRRIPVPYRSSHGKITSAELRKLKKSLIDKEHSKAGRPQMEEFYIEQKNYLYKFIRKKTSATDEDWDDLMRNALSMPGYLTESNIHGKIMGLCSNSRNLDLAKSYLAYLKKQGKKFNEVVIAEFLKTCYSCEPILTEKDLELVRKFAVNLINNCEATEEKLCSAVVKGFSVLNDWKTCMEFVENLEKLHDPSGTNVYSPLIICLLKNQQFELARKIMMESLSKKKNLTSSVYLKWIEIYQHDPDRLEQLLVIWKDYSVIPRKRVCDYLIQIYSQLPPKYQRKGEYTTIEPNGHCQNCENKLEKNFLLEAEFNELQDAFLNRVLFGNDVFLNTTPTEVQSFHKVVKAHAPFDVVIDGLNVMLGTGRRTMTHKSKALQDVVNWFFERDQKIFVVGRKHIRNLPYYAMENIIEKSTLFLIDNDSEDDPFIIYASLFSGPNCCFVTNDYYRSEKYRLRDDRLSDLFKRWQLSHQITFDHSSGDLQPPLQFRVCAQKTTPESWHIPYKADDIHETDQYGKSDLTKWLCLTLR